MKTTDKETLISLTEALLILPAEKREFMLGYAEGIAAMCQRAEQAEQAPAAFGRDGV